MEKIIQFFTDILAFFQFRREMKIEEMRRDSKFNKFNLKRNKFGNIVYVQLNFNNEDYHTFDYDEERMLASKLSPIVSYLSSELEWGEYLTPQVSNFVDDENNKTLSYGVLFIFNGYVATYTNVLITSILTLIGLMAGIICLIVLC